MNDIDPSATEPPPTQPIDIAAIMDRFTEQDADGMTE